MYFFGLRLYLLTVLSGQNAFSANQQSFAIDNVYVGPECPNFCSGHGKCNVCFLLNCVSKNNTCSSFAARNLPVRFLVFRTGLQCCSRRLSAINLRRLLCAVDVESTQSVADSGRWRHCRFLHIFIGSDEHSNA